MFGLACKFTIRGHKIFRSSIFRSSRPEVFCKKSVLKNFRPATLLKKRLWHRCFPVNFAKFLRIPFLQNTSDGCFWTWRKSLESCYNDIKTWLHLWKKDIGHSEFCSLQAQNLYNTASFFDVASLFDSIRKTPTGKISHLSNSPLESFHPENSHLEYSHPCF